MVKLGTGHGDGALEHERMKPNERTMHAGMHAGNRRQAMTHEVGEGKSAKIGASCVAF